MRSTGLSCVPLSLLSLALPSPSSTLPLPLLSYRPPGILTKTFNVGNYRRKLAGAQMPHDFFDVHNQEAAEVRKAAAMEALEDCIQWLQLPVMGSHSSLSSMDSAKTTTSSNSRAPSPISMASAEEQAKIAIYDATNSTLERRQSIRSILAEQNIQVRENGRQSFPTDILPR